MTRRPATLGATALALALLAAPASPADGRPVDLEPAAQEPIAEEPGAAKPPPVAAGDTWPAGSLGRQVGRDLEHVFARPFRLRGREWILPAALGATTLALYGVRDEVREEIQESRSEGRDDFLQKARITGKGAFVPAVAALLAGLGAARDSGREKRAALLLIESFTASAAWTAAGSVALATERPRDGDSVEFFDLDGHGVSLDTALSASMIAPLERTYLLPRPGETGARRFWRRTARGLLYLAPGLVALQRLNQDDHWLPDVFLGYTVGLLTGRSLTRNYPGLAPHRRETPRYRGESPIPAAGARRTESPGPPAPPSSLPDRTGR
jgi:hypothetical protein